MLIHRLLRLSSLCRENAHSLKIQFLVFAICQIAWRGYDFFSRLLQELKKFLLRGNTAQRVSRFGHVKRVLLLGSRCQISYWTHPPETYAKETSYQSVSCTEWKGIGGWQGCQGKEWSQENTAQSIAKLMIYRFQNIIRSQERTRQNICSLTPGPTMVQVQSQSLVPKSEQVSIYTTTTQPLGEIFQMLMNYSMKLYVRLHVTAYTKEPCCIGVKNLIYSGKAPISHSVSHLCYQRFFVLVVA